MKKVLLFLSFSIFCICGVFAQNLKDLLAEKKYKDTYKSEFTINNEKNTQENVIRLESSKEKDEFILSGYFNGQIIVNAKKATVELSNAYIENTNGEAAIIFNENGDLKIQKKTKNYIISSGNQNAKVAAIQGSNLDIKGEGNLIVKGYICHGLKAKKIVIKGSGNYYFSGTKDGSAINCNSFAVEENKHDFTIYCENSKNGIKADESIEISSGTFYFYNNNKDLKVDAIKEEDKKSDKKYGIFITGGKINNDEKK